MPDVPAAPTPHPKIIITGTGRAGTTLLVQILTDLGFDTGFKPNARINEAARAGLERNITGPTAPRIVKDPGLSRRLRTYLAEGTVAVEHVIVPMRDLDVATASRVRNANYGTQLRNPAPPGGLFGTRKATDQRAALTEVFYELFDTISEYDLPHTLLRFPRFATDPDYTYEKLGFLDPSITREQWKAAIEARADPALIHETPLTKQEASRARLGTWYANVVGPAIARLKRARRGRSKSSSPP